MPNFRPMIKVSFVRRRSHGRFPTGVLRCLLPMMPTQPGQFTSITNLQSFSSSNLISVCLLDEDESGLHPNTQLLSSAGCSVGRFNHPDAILECVQTNHPQTGVVNFGGPNADGLKVVSQFLVVWPSTSVIISLRVRAGLARPVLPGNELSNLIEQEYVRISTDPVLAEQSFSRTRRAEHGCRT